MSLIYFRSADYLSIVNVISLSYVILGCLAGFCLLFQDPDELVLWSTICCLECLLCLVYSVMFVQSLMHKLRVSLYCKCYAFFNDLYIVTVTVWSCYEATHLGSTSLTHSLS